MAVEVKDIMYDMSTFKSKSSNVMDQVSKVIVGKNDLIEDIFIALLAEGNVLLEGVPGVAKTTIAKAFASSIGLDFKRIQFVPDILPSDVIGSSIFNQKEMDFSIHQGPVFTNILLVDEINRASPKIQSSLLEAMEEKQVSIDGVTFQLPHPFMVITTQNPIDVIGTYPLPEAQIDRFMFKLNVEYPSFSEELDILRSRNTGSLPEVSKVLSLEDVLEMIEAVKKIHVDDKVLEYIRDLIMASRSHEKLLLGGSPRASLSLLRSSKAVAAMDGRDYVIPDDIKYLVPKALGHRLIVKPEYELENVTPGDVVKELLAQVKVPT
ncbi:MAG TPA: MoxR family ATPase [Methanocellaceae archaeon]